MQRSCYRCGAPVEEHTTFCPACGAPQIKVALPATANLPSPPAMPPGTPDSLSPPALPAQVIPASPIEQKKFWRIAVPFSLISGAALAFLGPFGIPIFLFAVVLAVSRYRRNYPGPLPASRGARLGAFTGLLTFIVAAGLGAIEALRNTSEIRNQFLQVIQQKAADPNLRTQQAAQFLATDQGFMFFLIFLGVFLLVFCLMLSSAVGALTVVFSGNKRR